MDEPPVTPSDIREAAARLRDARCSLLAREGTAGLQKRAVDALAQVAALWRDPEYRVRRRAERENAAFPFPMVWVSLSALLDSFDPDPLWRLIREDGLEGVAGEDIVGHVIASNTPLLAWTSIARALLVGGASIVKLPSHPAAAWAEYFVDSLADVDPPLAELIQLLSWKGGARDLDQALCDACDRMVVYGSDETIGALKALMPQGSELIGYGHRVSLGVVAAGAEPTQAARGLARDILLYDQGGCLSPHCVFVEGEFDAAASFASRLAHALAEESRLPECRMPNIEKDSARAGAVREQRALARMEPGAQLWEDAGLRWTVAALPVTEFRVSQTHGVVYVLPLRGNNLMDVLAGIPYLQGLAIASAGTQDTLRWRENSERCGISYVCSPGELQRPPLCWRQNGWPVLRTLTKDYRNGV